MKNTFSLGDEIKVVFGPRHIWFQESNLVRKVKVVRSEKLWIGCEDLDNNDYYHISLVEDGGWEDVKFLKEEKKQPFFSIKEGSIESAARFIIANNKYMHNRSVDYMIGSIKRVIEDMVDKIKNGGEAWYCATAGYVVMIQQEDEDYYVIEVLVDPSVSQDRGRINVENII